MPTPANLNNLRSLVEHRAQSTPDDVFVIFDNLANSVTKRSYGAFERDTNRTAHLLRDLSVRPGNKVCLLLDNNLDFLTLWFAATKIGAVIVPVNTAVTAEELTYLIDHSESSLIFTQSARLDTALQVSRDVEKVIICGSDAPGSMNRLMTAHPESPPSGPTPTAASDAAILYTSGTTALPKGVVVTHANYIYAGNTVAQAINLTPDDRHLVVLPLFHANAQYYSTMSSLVAGSSFALMARFSASRYFDQATTYNCTVGSLFAAPIRMLLAQKRRLELKTNSLRVVLFAQNLTSCQLRDWHERFEAPLLQLWGMTETMGPPLMNPLTGERRNMSIGHDAEGYTIKLVDDAGDTVPRGQLGQILVSGIPGQSLMRGYFKDARATAATIQNGWLWSGDTARQDSGGYVHFIDRAKDVIKRAGENIAASEVETVIREHPGVFDCAVIGIPDAIRDEAILAVVVASDGTAVTAEDITAWCQQRLAHFRVPQFVRFRSKLPRTAVGKIQKHILRQELQP